MKTSFKKTETVFPVGASALIRAVWVAAAGVGHVSKGTYNKADPTVWEKVSCYLTYENDPYLMREFKHKPTEEELKEYPAEMFKNQPPPSACYKLWMHDVTWGVEIRLTFVNSEVDDEEQITHIGTRSKEVFKFYLDHDDGKICWVDDDQLEPIRNFLLGCICGDVTFSEKPFKFQKDMTEQELADYNMMQEIEAADAALRRSCE